MSNKRSAVLDLSCAACGSNRLTFPSTDDGNVTCDDCGHTSETLGELKARFAEGSHEGSADPETGEGRAALRDRHAREVDISQADLKDSIAETDRLVDESDEMLRRHRRECDDQEAG
jgi:hypothetical protein